MAQLPTPQAFFLKTPPYLAFEIGSTRFVDTLRVQFYQGTLDTHCLGCGKESVFKCLAPPFRTPNEESKESRAVSIDEILEGNLKVFLPHGALEGSKIIGPCLLSDFEPHIRGDRAFEVTFACTRDPKHKLFFFFRVEHDKVAKVGQSP